jgi:hypothetical protein
MGSTSASISVATGVWFKDATVMLCRPGSLSGTVSNERGEPVIGVYVRALLATRVAGHDRYAVGPLVMTDDRGIYRIGQLMPGRYVVMVPSAQASAPAVASAAALQGISAQTAANAQAAGRPLPSGDPMVDIDATTRRVALLTYTDGYLFERKSGDSWQDVFGRAPRPLHLPPLPQGEAITFDRRGDTLWVTSERVPAPLLRISLDAVP